MTSRLAGAGDSAAAASLAAGEALFKRPWRFLMSAPSAEFLPPADRPEIAFAGRSNVGKSSLINALIGQGALARISNTPGRTQELNYYLCEEPLYLVDMPGYGFAKAPKDLVKRWTALVKAYLAGRQTLRRVFLLIDARHGLKPVDREIMSLLDTAGVVYQAVLTKIDKPKETELERVVEATRAGLRKHAAAMIDVLETSADKRLGIEALRAEIAGILRG
jgi:GTP-binding protein